MTGLAVLVAVAGTRWSIWIRGSGGRGNTLGVAALLVLSWPAVAIGVVVWIAARILTKSSFWATRCWLLSLPLSLGLATMSWCVCAHGRLLGLFYLSEHKTGTDDHTILKETWPSLWAFLTAPRRGKQGIKSGRLGRIAAKPGSMGDGKFSGRRMNCLRFKRPLLALIVKSGGKSCIATILRLFP